MIMTVINVLTFKKLKEEKHQWKNFVFFSRAFTVIIPKKCLGRNLRKPFVSLRMKKTCSNHFLCFNQYNNKWSMQQKKIQIKWKFRISCHFLCYFWHNTREMKKEKQFQWLFYIWIVWRLTGISKSCLIRFVLTNNQHPDNKYNNLLR